MPGNKGTVIYRISHGNKTRCITTSYLIHPAQWNYRQNMPLTDISMKSSDIPEITRNINRDIRLLERIIRTLSNRAVTFDADDIAKDSIVRQPKTHCSIL